MLLMAPFVERSSQEKSSDERSEAGSQQPEEDYDVDEEYDNDYAENYFDNGEADDNDDLGGGGGDDGGGMPRSRRFYGPILTAFPLQATIMTRCRWQQCVVRFASCIVFVCNRNGRFNPTRPGRRLL